MTNFKLWWLYTEDDLNTLRESLAWAYEDNPQASRDAYDALDRLTLHIIQLSAMLDEAVQWLVSPQYKTQLEEYGDFLERYRSFKKLQEESSNHIEI